MNSGTTIGASLALLLATLSGCVVTNVDDSGALETSGDSTTSASMGAAGPTAVVAILSNGTQLYSSADGTSASEETDDADSTAATGNATTGNATGGNTTASGNATAGNTTSPSGNATGAASDNSTSNATSADVVLEPGANVTFDGSDSEGTNLTYSWSVGNVTSDNATFDHTFDEAGTYNVTLVVTDAENATDEVTVEVLVEASGPAPGTPMGDRTETFRPSGDRIGAPNCLVGGNAESTYAWNILDVDENGTAMKAIKLKVTGEHGSAGVAHRITLTGPDGTELGEGTEVEVDGEFPAGEYTIVYRLCGPYSTPANTETFATATYVSG